MRGKLIVIEGLDGSGKSTQIEILKKEIEALSNTVKQIKLPCYESDSSAPIRMYLAGEFGKKPEDVNAYAASAFYAVDRFASFKTIWKEDYESGCVILADRYTTSNAYHQMNKVPESEWDNFTQQLDQLPRTNKQARIFSRFFTAKAASCELDKQGRILLPQTLREFAELEKDVVLSGNLNRIEIWSKANWTEYNAYDDMDDIAEQMTDLGLSI